ncbi:hypothetical protein D3C80_1625790 [compost metagenome]
MSYSTPSRRAPSAWIIDWISRASKVASRIARPAGRIAWRSALTPSMASSARLSHLRILRLSQARPTGVISPLPWPPAWIARLMARMVPEEPTASFQPSLRTACSKLISSSRAEV